MMSKEERERLWESLWIVRDKLNRPFEIVQYSTRNVLLRSEAEILDKLKS